MLCVGSCAPARDPCTGDTAHDEAAARTVLRVLGEGETGAPSVRETLTREHMQIMRGKAAG